MKKKIAIIAPTGMLGSMIYHILKEKYDLVLLYRNEQHLELLDKKYGGVNNHKSAVIDIASIVSENDNFYNAQGSHTSEFINLVRDTDVIINCAGIINKHTLKNIFATTAVNSIFPYLLSIWFPQRVIHFSTDCVFDGRKKEPYIENDNPSPVDLYGLTKLYGEAKKNILILRTSFIGPELHTHESLHDWFVLQKSNNIDGYTTHLWSGVTTKQMALICNAIIDGKTTFPKEGLFHIFSSSINKYQLLLLLKQKYNLSINVHPVKRTFVDRRLSSQYLHTAHLGIPTIEEMIHEL